MYIDKIPNRNSRPTILLRESHREGSKIIKKTIANITNWPETRIEGLRKLLRDQPLVSPDEAFAIERTIFHGHVSAVLGMIRKIRLDKILSSRDCHERSLVLAMIAERLIVPCSKLATTRVWHSSSLAEELGVQDADEDELYNALDWLLSRQKRIEKKLAKQHLEEGNQVFYDVTSSYYEGRTCILAQFGYNRDKKKGKQIIVYGVMTDREGRPLAVEVYPGNTGDPKTVPDQVEKLRERFGLQRVVLVGDRGMLTDSQLEMLKNYPGIGWISALRGSSIRELMEKKELQMSLFDTRNLAEINSPQFPGERLIACYNPFLAEERREKRKKLIEATSKKLEKIVREVKRRTKSPLNKGEIGQKIGKVINSHKVGKHFTVYIEDGSFSFEQNENSIKREAHLDGIYVVRTSEPKEELSADDTVRSYKNLSRVEQAFRCIKGVELLIRPIFHREADRVRAHIFLCLLAYYVEWHMRAKLKSLLFDDEELDELRFIRDPVVPAKPSKSAKKKKSVRKTKEGYPIHSFKTLLNELGTICKNTCRMKNKKGFPTFIQITEPTPYQAHVFDLLDLYPG